MQKTITISGKKFSAKGIEKLFDSDCMTNGNDYIVCLNGHKFFANYREIQDAYFAPVCNKQNANAIVLIGVDYSFTWLTL